LEQTCEISEAVRYSRMIRPEARVEDCQGAAIKRLRLAGAACRLEQTREMVEVDGDFGMVRRIDPLVDRQRTA
jgi:hypothetical protein